MAVGVPSTLSSGRRDARRDDRASTASLPLRHSSHLHWSVLTTLTTQSARRVHSLPDTLTSIRPTRSNSTRSISSGLVVRRQVVRQKSNRWSLSQILLFLFSSFFLLHPHSLSSFLHRKVPSVWEVCESSVS